jgi:hypothetical protein
MMSTYTSVGQLSHLLRRRNGYARTVGRSILLLTLSPVLIRLRATSPCIPPPTHIDRGLGLRGIINGSSSTAGPRGHESHARIAPRLQTSFDERGQTVKCVDLQRKGCQGIILPAAIQIASASVALVPADVSHFREIGSEVGMNRVRV